MKCVILHGSKLLPTGSLSPDMNRRIAILRTLLATTPYDLLVITGGVSSKVKKPEAEVIFERIRDWISIPVNLEVTSKTTVQNIQNTAKILENAVIDHLVVITSIGSLSRFRRLYKYHLPRYVEKTDFIASENTHPFYMFFRESFLSAIYLIDPHERILRPFIKIFRS